MAQIEEEEELAAFVLQTVSKGIKREPFVLNSKEIDNHDPIEESLSLRKKKGNLTEVVPESCLLHSSEESLKRMKTGKTKQQLEDEDEIANFILQESSKVKREPFV